MNKNSDDSLPEDIGSRYGSLADLPDELLVELVGIEATEDEKNVLYVLDKHLEGVGSINEILIALYRLENLVHERKAVSARIGRMVNKGQLIAVDGKRGVYSIPIPILVPEAPREK